MKFDPTYDYGKLDLNIAENLVCYNFRELIINLITLSSPAKRQLEIIGIGAVCNEMAVDFDEYFTSVYQLYIDNNFLTQDQLEKFIELDNYFDERSGKKQSEFWDDFLLETNPEWQIVRQKAMTILEMLGMQNLTIEFDRTEEYKMINGVKQITAQTTKTKLIRKNGV